MVANPRKRAVTHPIALCPSHGFFPATAIALGPGSTMGIYQSRMSCPQCGTPSEILPGMYRGGVDTINLLIDPSISLQALGALRKLAERAQAGKISVQEAKREAEKIHPKAAKLFDIVNWSDQAKATLYGAIIGAVALIAAARITSPASQTTAINPVALERVIQKSAKPPLIAKSHVKAPQPKQHPKKRR